MRMISNAAVILTTFCLSLQLCPEAFAVGDKDNHGQWNKPAENDQPDKEVPGFFVNLGPTGARAILTENTFVVRYIFKDSPATKLLKLDDEIVGVFGKPFSPHHFGGGPNGYEGPIMDMGEAIEKAEGKKDGKLVLNLNRAGKPLEVTIQLESLGSFSPTFPFNCKKSETIRTKALKFLADRQAGGHAHARSMVTLALLTSDDRQHQAMGKSMAQKWASENQDNGTWTWDLSYRLITLSEYFLLTKDSTVLPAMKSSVELLEKAQVKGPSIVVWGVKGDKYLEKCDYAKVEAAQQLYDGGFGHGPYVAVGGKNGYGPMQYTTIFAVTAWQLATMCGVETKPDYIKRSLGFIHRGVNAVGYIAYGGEFTLNCGIVDAAAWRLGTGGGNYIGRTGAAVIAHKLSPEFPDSADYLKKFYGYYPMAYKSLPDGHADANLGIFWGFMGAAANEDPLPLRTVFDYHKAYFNMARCFDGSFVLQPGRDYADVGYYFSSRYHPTASVALALGLNNPKLMIQGIQVSIPGVNPKALKGSLQLAYKAIVTKNFNEAGRQLKYARGDKKTSEADLAICGAMSAFVEERLMKEVAIISKIEKTGDIYALNVAIAKIKPIFGKLDSYIEKIKPLEDKMQNDPWKTELSLGRRYTTMLATLHGSKKTFHATDLEVFADKNPNSLYGKWAGEAAKAFKADGSLIDPSTAKPATRVTVSAQ